MVVYSHTHSNGDPADVDSGVFQDFIGSGCEIFGFGKFSVFFDQNVVHSDMAVLDWS